MLLDEPLGLLFRSVLPFSSAYLKTIKLLQNGQTWYEKEGGFKLDNNQIYEAVKKVQTAKPVVKEKTAQQEVKEKGGVKRL